MAKTRGLLTRQDTHRALPFPSMRVASRENQIHIIPAWAVNRSLVDRTAIGQAHHNPKAPSFTNMLFRPYESKSNNGLEQKLTQTLFFPFSNM